MMLNLKQSVSELVALLPRILWVFAVVGVALVAGESSPGADRGSVASHTSSIMDAPVATGAGLGVLERR